MNTHVTALESSRVHVTETDNTLRLSWDNRDVPKDNSLLGCLVLFWLLWATGTLRVTALLLSGETDFSFAILCVFTWGVTILVTWLVLGRTWREWVELTPVSVRHGFKGLFAPRPKTYPVASGAQLAVGHYDKPDTRSFVTLNLLPASPSGLTERVMLGYWLAPKLKVQVFEAIAAWAQQHNVPLTLTRLES